MDIEKKEPNPSEQTSKDEIIVRQKVSGGLLPFEREWVFYSNGEIHHPNGAVSNLSERQLKKLVLSSQMRRGLESMDTLYLAPMGSADFSTMELTLFDSDQIQKIRIEDANDTIPTVFWECWDNFQDLARKSLDRSKEKD
ncbi:hypothetical protein [Flagellimonas eckloniae]|nr:hypothetical protein [Allomuricauda eckloniae]